MATLTRLPLLRLGPLSNRVYVITRWREDAKGGIVALCKHDVTADFIAIAADMFPSLVETGVLVRGASETSDG